MGRFNLFGGVVIMLALIACLSLGPTPAPNMAKQSTRHPLYDPVSFVGTTGAVNMYFRCVSGVCGFVNSATGAPGTGGTISFANILYKNASQQPLVDINGASNYIHGASGTHICWTSSAVDANGTACDTGFKRSAASVAVVTNGSTGGGALEFIEQTLPSAPTNAVRLAVRDNAGTTEFCLVFPGVGDVTCFADPTP